MHSMLVLTFQIGNNRLALDIRRVREVVPRVELKRSPTGPAWLAGLFVYRGRAVPVIDLHQLLAGGECPHHLSSRIILVPRVDATSGEESLLGLLAAQVADLREVEPGHTLPVGGMPGLGTPLVDRDGILHLLDLDRLIPTSELGSTLPLLTGRP
jgi:chemotaxis-related protein WspB